MDEDKAYTVDGTTKTNPITAEAHYFNERVLHDMPGTAGPGTGHFRLLGALSLLMGGVLLFLSFPPANKNKKEKHQHSAL